MVMAAGLGTRLKPFTDRAPKPLLPLLGVPMGQFALDAAGRAGVRRVAVNIHAHPELARARWSSLERPGNFELLLSDESSELLGSGGGVRTAATVLASAGSPGPHYLLNADTLCDVDLEALGREHVRLRRERGVDLTLAVFKHGPRGARYREIVFDPSSGIITRLGELQEGRPFFVGVAVIEPGAIAHLPERSAFEFVPEILKPAVERGKAGVFVTEGLWYDVGSPSLWHSTHLELMRLYESGALPELWRDRIAKVARRLGPGRLGGEGWSVDSATGVVSYGSPGAEAGPLIRYEGVEVRFS